MDNKKHNTNSDDPVITMDPDFQANFFYFSTLMRVPGSMKAVGELVKERQQDMDAWTTLYPEDAKGADNE